MSPDVPILIWLLLGIMLVTHTARAQIGSIPSSTSTADVLSEAYTHEDTENKMYSSYGYLKCTSEEVLAPTTTEEVSAIVKRLAQEAVPVRVRVTRHGFHSMAGFVCPGRRTSTKFHAGESAHHEENDGAASVTLLFHCMNRVVAVDGERRRLTVEAGITLQSLVDAAEENAMEVPLAAMPVYGNLTLGGVIATSAHGTGAHRASTLGSLVRRVRWVNGKGEVVVSDAETENGAEEIAALVGGLGLVGIVTEFTIQLDPAGSVTVVETRQGLDDGNIAADLKKMLEDETPSVSIFWRPDFGKYKAVLFTPHKVGEKLPASAPPFRPKARGGFMIAVRDDVAGLVKEALSAWESDPLEASPTADVTNAGACGVSAVLFTAPLLYDEADGSLIDNATLPTNRVTLAPECSPKCVHQIHHTGAGVKDSEFTLKLSQLENFVADVKAIVRAELRSIQDHLDSRFGEGKATRCMPPGYFWMRFGGKSNSLLSTNTGDEAVVHIQLISLEAARSSPEKHQKGEAIQQTFEQLMLCKYKARPHWGKNQERTFRHPRCHVRDNYPEGNFAQMVRMQQKHDPKKMFEPQLFKHVMQRSGPTYYAKCASAAWCYCEADVHCPTGDVCRPSPVFPEYKICKLDHASGDHYHDEL